MTRPHEYDKAVAVIEDLSNEDLAQMELWEVLELAMPRGVAVEVAETLNIPKRTVQSWRVDPELVTGSLKEVEPNGRRGGPHQGYQFLLTLNGVFSPGAQLIHRWEGLKLAKGQAIQGRETLQAVMELADEARAVADEARAAQEKAQAFAQKVAGLLAAREKT